MLGLKEEAYLFFITYERGSLSQRNGGKKNMRNLKKTLTLLLTLALLIGSMSGMAFATDPDILTVNIKNSGGTVIATEGYTRAELEAMVLEDSYGDALRAKFTSLDRLPAWRTTVATGVKLETLINNANGSTMSFNSADSFTFADVNSSKPGSFTTTYGNLYDSSRSYFSNLPTYWTKTVLDASGKVVTPGYLNTTNTSLLAGTPVTPMIALNYFQERHLADAAASDEDLNLPSSGTPMLCYGMKATELLSPLSYTNNNFVREIDVITLQKAI